MTDSHHYLGAEKLDPVALENAGSKPLLRPEPQARVDELAYVLFERKDVATQRAFLEDFGMQLAGEEQGALYFRGHGPSHWFYRLQQGGKDRYLGAGFTVTSQEALVSVANRHGVAMEDIDGPGGGQRVRLRDPDGFIVDFVHGRQAAQRLPCRQAPPVVNTPTDKPRINTGVRSTPQPCALEKVGHLVMSVSNFQRSTAWYMEELGLIPTDVQCVDDGEPVLAFMRCDRGDTPADHHTVVLLQHLGPAIMHTAYETLDIDSIGQGAQHLHKKGWKHYWGIGRHVLGSQFFDYWLDPAGVEMEHYADGDVFTADDPTRYYPLDPGSLWAWGDDAPPPPTPPPWTLLKLLLSGGVKKLPPSMKKMRKAMAGAPRPWLGKN